MKILVTGSSGFVGSALAPELVAEGHQVIRMVRRPAKDGEVRWDPAEGVIDAASLRGLDAVVHLAGENIATRRWRAPQ